MHDTTHAEDEALQRFQRHIDGLREELQLINRGLGRQDLLGLASRTRELLRKTKGLLDGNVAFLFAGQPDRVPEELYQLIEYGQAQVTRALAEEYEFDAIEKRLYMATALAEYVIAGVTEALSKLR